MENHVNEEEVSLMEKNFLNLEVEKFIDESTKNLKNSKDGEELISYLEKSKEHLKCLKFLPHYKQRIRKVMIKGGVKKDEFMKFYKKIDSVDSNYFASKGELEIGDQCMIAEPIFNDLERDMFMKRTEVYKFHIKFPKQNFAIHTWTIFQEKKKKEETEVEGEGNGKKKKKKIRKKFVLMMHGFGMDCSKHDWMKFCYPLYQRGFYIIMVDFPGFGRSSGRDLQSISWKRFSNKMMFTILDHFKAKNIHVFADCGGAAAFLKLLVQKPKLFGKRHVLIRPTMGHFPNIKPIIIDKKIRMWVTWIVDKNHPRNHASFKNWTALKTLKNVTFVVQDGYVKDKISYYSTQYTPGVTRTGSSFNLFNFNKNYLKKIWSFFDN